MEDSYSISDIKSITDEIIKILFDLGCIKSGKFTLKNGGISKYYFDMKNIVSDPSLVSVIGDWLYKELIQNGEFDIICGVPYGGLPFACYISTKYKKPMIMLRDKPKEYGLKKRVEGKFDSNQKCVVIEDVITTGGSLEDACLALREEGVNVIGAGVIFNRQQNYNVSTNVTSILCKNDVTRHMLNQLKNKGRTLCFAADIMEHKKLLKVIDDVGSNIGICKIHSDTINYNNDVNSDFNGFIWKLLELSQKHGFLIMEDRKFVDISSVVEKQYYAFHNWADMVTVHGSVSKETVEKLSGALIVANMSNNDYDFTDRSKILAQSCMNNVVGFISQHRINIQDETDLYTMTPGVSFKKGTSNDQRYREPKDVDTDFYIVGRGIYMSDDPKKAVDDMCSKISSV
jgi:uridine monophosphate synthetase